MSTYHNNTYPADAYQDMPSSFDPPEDGHNEYSQESQDSTRAQFDPSEDRHGVYPLKPAPTRAQHFQQAQIDPPEPFDLPEEPRDDFTHMKEQPPRPPSPPLPEPTPPPPGEEEEEPAGNIIMERFKTDTSCYSDHLVALAYTGACRKE